MFKKILVTTSILATTAFATSPAHSVSIADLKKQMAEMQRQMQVLQAKLDAQESKIAESAKSGGIGGDVKVSFRPGPKIESSDGKYSMQIGGRVQADAAFFKDDIVDHSDGTEFRRARIYVKGKLGDDWSYKFENDFAGDMVDVKDAYIAYSGFDNVKLKAGQFKEPFSLENMTSSRFVTFLERASLNAFAPGRNIGIGASTAGKNWTLAAGVFGEEAADSGSDDESYGVTARGTFAPIAEKDKSIHLGVAGSWRDAGHSSGNTVRFRARPEAHQASVRLVDTGTIAAVDSYSMVGLEAAGVAGPFSLQGEYVATNVNTSGTASDPTFHSHYVFASYFLTGESRNYVAKKGKFDRVKPNKNFSLNGDGIGAWEVALRYSGIDLNDAGILGGEMDNYTFGINWYPTPYTRLMTNYVITDTDQNAPTPGDSPEVFMVRAQVDF